MEEKNRVENSKKSSELLESLITDLAQREHSEDHHSKDSVELFSPREVWRILKIHSFFIWTLVIGSIALTTLYTLFAAPEYKATVVISVVPNESYRSLSEVSQFVRGEEVLLNKMRSLTEYIRSPEMADKILEALSREQSTSPILRQSGFTRFFTNIGFIKPLTVEEALNLHPRSQVAAEAMSYLTATPNFNDSTLVIEGSTSDPQLSAFLANQAAKALLEINHRVGLKMVVEVKQFLQTQAGQLGTKLEVMENELTRFQSDNKILSVDEAERSMYSAIDRDNEQLINVKVALAANEKMVKDIESESKKMKDNFANPAYYASNLYLDQLQHRINMVKYQQAIDGTESVNGKKKQVELEGLVNSYKEALDKNYVSYSVSPLEYYNGLQEALISLKKDNQKLKAELSAVDSLKGVRKDDIPKLATTTQKLADLRRNIQLTTDLYMTVKKKMQEMDIQEAGTSNDISLLSEASIPTLPHTVSLWLKILFAGMIGLFFAATSVLITEAFIPTVRSRHDLEHRGFSILGEVSRIGEKTDHKNAIVVLRDFPNSYEADVLRSMRMKLVTHAKASVVPGAKPKAKIFMMASARGSNGKTFTAVNLAVSLSRSQYKTLLIDLDLRRPSVRDYFPDQKWAGSIDMLVGQEDKIDSLHVITPLYPLLGVAMGAGTVTEPAELLDSKVMESFLKTQKENYDFIIIDLPPILGVVDAMMIAPLVDHIIFITEHRRTHRADVDLAASILSEVYKSKMLAVINFVHREYTYYDTIRYYQHKKDPKTEVA